MTDETEYAPDSDIPMRPLPSNIGLPGFIAAVIGIAFAILNPFIGVFWMTILGIILVANRKSAANSPAMFYIALAATVLGLFASIAILVGFITIT